MPSHAGQTKRKQQSWLAKIVSGLFSAAVAILAMEGLLRVIEVPLVEPSRFISGNDSNRAFEFDFQTMWRFPKEPQAKWGPAAADEFSNRFGCRGYEPAQEKAPNDLRVICVGASGAGGFGLPLGWAFPIQLERLLQKRYPASRVETVLCGVAGYSSEQQRALLFGRLNDFQPDLVILHTGSHNDLALASELNDQANLDRLRPGISRTLDLIRFKFPAVNEMLLTKKASDPDPARVPLNRFRDNVKEMVAWTRNNQAKALVVLPFATDRNKKRDIYRDALKAESSRLDIPLIDQKDVAQEPSDWLDALHFSRRGHEKMASRLMKVIEDQSLIHESFPRPDSTEPQFTFDLLPPNRVLLGGERRIELKLNGVSPQNVSRVWCADLLTKHRVAQEDTLVVTLPRVLPVGPATIEVVAENGASWLKDAVTIEAPDLDVQIVDHEGVKKIVLMAELPAYVEIKFLATLDPQLEPVTTRIGPMCLLPGATWPPQNQKIGKFLKRSIFAESMSEKRGRWGMAKLATRAYPAGTKIAIQGLMSIPYPGKFEPVGVTKPFILTVPKH